MYKVSRLKFLFIAISVLFLSNNLLAKSDNSRETIDLSGKWNFSLDTEDKGVLNEYWNKDLLETVTLPGTTDTNQKGIKNDNRSETTHLSRYYTYEGVAWYSKEVDIPANWRGKNITLYLERTRPTIIWVDGKKVGESNLLSTAQKFDLSRFLSPGKHKITIRVDNGESIPKQIRSSSHSCTESTQTNWNGIIGRIELQAKNTLHIESIQTFPQLSDNSVKVKITLSKTDQLRDKQITLSATAFNSKKRHKAKAKSFYLKTGQKVYEFTYPLGKKALKWSDLDPALYELKAEIKDFDVIKTQFGLRDFSIEGNHFTINGTKTFLRGKHDAAVFPLTGHTAMDVEEWRRYFRISKSYGLNHVRFHSWCPPAACFEAADLEGVFLQPELPVWGRFTDESPELMNFLLKDGEKIMSEYSNHASFVMFALGNELSGEVEVMKRFIDHYRKIEPRHLYAYGSNIYLGTRGYFPGEDFFVTCRTGSGEKYSTHTRASFSFADAEEGGYLNNTYPNLTMHFDDALKTTDVPVIGHETGQFQVYPNYKEIEKYTGVLAPWNFEVFRDRLDKAGMLNQAEDFFKASGAWSVELYRADIEMNLRSKLMAGFQLLDLQDYPGQGSAYVGVVDAFMDSKGLIEPKKWREFCSEVVPLLITEKYTWNSYETFSGKVKVSNYSNKSLKGKRISWTLTDGSKVLSKGQSKVTDGLGLIDIEDIQFKLPNFTKAKKLELSINIKGTSYRNSYPLWIYPDKKEINSNNIIIANELNNELFGALKQGKSVLLIPSENLVKDVSVGGLFQTDYWNYRMFKGITERMGKPVSPGTLGILTDPEHALFNDFPTEYHTNWQWYPIIKKSNPLILDKLPNDFRPIVQVIDNVERNHKLGLVFEMNIEKGKLLICMSKLDVNSDKPEEVQFYTSLLDYMNSDKFNPTHSFSSESLKELFESSNDKKEIKILDNISYD